jgi:hypothetical protein
MLSCTQGSLFPLRFRIPSGVKHFRIEVSNGGTTYVTGGRTFDWFDCLQKKSPVTYF